MSPTNINLVIDMLRDDEIHEIKTCDAQQYINNICENYYSNDAKPFYGVSTKLNDNINNEHIILFSEYQQVVEYVNELLHNNMKHIKLVNNSVYFTKIIELNVFMVNKLMINPENTDSGELILDSYRLAALLNHKLAVSENIIELHIFKIRKNQYGSIYSKLCNIIRLSNKLSNLSKNDLIQYYESNYKKMSLYKKLINSRNSLYNKIIKKQIKNIQNS
jgi:hypothetical protein